MICNFFSEMTVKLLLSDATEYANLVFNTFDEDGNGEISFQVT